MAKWKMDIDWKVYCGKCKEYLPSVCVRHADFDHPYDETEQIAPTQFCPACGERMDI